MGRCLYHMNDYFDFIIDLLSVFRKQHSDKNFIFRFALSIKWVDWKCVHLHHIITDYSYWEKTTTTTIVKIISILFANASMEFLILEWIKWWKIEKKHNTQLKTIAYNELWHTVNIPRNFNIYNLDL